MKEILLQGIAPLITIVFVIVGNFLLIWRNQGKLLDRLTNIEQIFQLKMDNLDEKLTNRHERFISDLEKLENRIIRLEQYYEDIYRQGLQTYLKKEIQSHYRKEEGQ